jgi:hypothetical protein
MIPALLDRCKAAIISAISPSPWNSPLEASSQPRRRTPVDALLDESSLLTLAEAIAQKISKDRAALISQDWIPDPVLSQEVCCFLSLPKTLSPTTQSGDLFLLLTNERTRQKKKKKKKSYWLPKWCSCQRFTHSRRFYRPCGL